MAFFQAGTNEPLRSVTTKQSSAVHCMILSYIDYINLRSVRFIPNDFRFGTIYFGYLSLLRAKNSTRPILLQTLILLSFFLLMADGRTRSNRAMDPYCSPGYDTNQTALNNQRLIPSPNAGKRGGASDFDNIPLDGDSDISLDQSWEYDGWPVVKRHDPRDVVAGPPQPPPPPKSSKVDKGKGKDEPNQSTSLERSPYGDDDVDDNERWPVVKRYNSPDLIIETRGLSIANNRQSKANPSQPLNDADLEPPSDLDRWPVVTRYKPQDSTTKPGSSYNTSNGQSEAKSHRQLRFDDETAEYIYSDDSDLDWDKQPFDYTVPFERPMLEERYAFEVQHPIVAPAIRQALNACSTPQRAGRAVVDQVQHLPVRVAETYNSAAESISQAGRQAAAVVQEGVMALQPFEQNDALGKGRRVC